MYALAYLFLNTAIKISIGSGSCYMRMLQHNLVKTRFVCITFAQYCMLLIFDHHRPAVIC